MCELKASPDCTGRFEHPHHRKLRAHGRSDEPGNLMAVCSECHLLIHRFPAQSYVRGWLVRSYEDPAEVAVT